MENKMYWLTSDHHFDHFNIISYCNRPFKSLDHMNLELIRRWNEKIKENDTVYHLGDIVFGKSNRGYDYFAEQLNGKIILIKGNHDDRSDVKSILTSCTLNFGGIDWYCEHYPSVKFKYNLCGHVHEKFKFQRRGRNILTNVGVDVWGFAPVSIQEILEQTLIFERGSLKQEGVGKLNI